MIERYSDPIITEIFSDRNKVNGWQAVELAVILARVNLGLVDRKIYDEIKRHWDENPVNLDWWKAEDKRIHHDLNAFINERLRFLPVELQPYVHDQITSFDTEESPSILAIGQATKEVARLFFELTNTLEDLARKHRYTLMMFRTHGQNAELGTLGVRCLSWLSSLNIVANNLLTVAESNLGFSKISGPVGNYGGIDPELETEALKILGLDPLINATQILPRTLHAPIANNLANLVLAISKIGLDIRLGARSGRPILQEPFGKNQTGSSAMPGKKNTIRTEQLEGLARMALGYSMMISNNIPTWEERAIEQSCVERVAWPDLFHVTVQAIKVLTGVLKNLQVFRDNMILEIIDSRGTYASSEAKEFLKKHLCPKGLTAEEVYRLVQLACFNVLERDDSLIPEPPISWPSNFGLHYQMIFDNDKEIIRTKPTIQSIIHKGFLRKSNSLNIEQEKIDHYNRLLKELFEDHQLTPEWAKIFDPEYLLRNQDYLYKSLDAKDQEHDF
jgi:adenylosuccinate lyase